jgi:murein L,D-transpeptidase YcbB/YkuD
VSTFSDVIAVLGSNSSDIEDAINKLGGVGVLISVAPDLLRIMATLQKTNQTPDVAAQVLTYSAATAARVKTFQALHGLTVDGIVGDQTWSMVEKLTLSKLALVP